MSFPNYFQALDAESLEAEYPLGSRFLERFRNIGRDELTHLQNQRFVKLMERAWQVPFYRRLWGEKGIQPGDIKDLRDITKLPTYSKTDLMNSVAEYPPLGDYHGLESYPADERPQLILHTTSGTTGRPQPLLYGPRSREIQNLLLARVYRWQGLRPEDVVHSVYGHGLINGGHYVRETILHFTNSLMLTAGTGVETRSVTQVELMRDFNVTVIIGFADYIRHLAKVARENGIIPGKDIKVRMISAHMGQESRKEMTESWPGAEIFDWYGVGDTGVIAGEAPDHAGLYVMEDAHYVELIDPETHQPVAEGENGNICDTVLFKDDYYPVVRFNTNDVSGYADGQSPLGLKFRRLKGFLGRSDNMVKLRGINIFPTAIGPLLKDIPEATGEYVCRVDRIEERDELTVVIEGEGNRQGLQQTLESLFKRKLGIEVQVELVSPGELAPLTGLETRQKPIRLIDNRFK